MKTLQQDKHFNMFNSPMYSQNLDRYTLGGENDYYTSQKEYQMPKISNRKITMDPIQNQ